MAIPGGPGGQPQSYDQGPPPPGPQPNWGGQSAHHQPPHPAFRPPGRRKRVGLWLGIGAGVLVLIVVAAIGAMAAFGAMIKNHQRSQAAAAAASDARTLEKNSSSAPAPSALVSGRSGAGLPCPQAKGDGPWQLIEPGLNNVDFCGSLTDGNTVEKTEVNGAYLWFQDPGGFGTYSKKNSYIAFDAVENGVPYLGLQVYGFNGKFTNLDEAMGALEQNSVPDPNEKFYTVPPGPHGGKMQCEMSSDPKAGLYLQECVWATTTTLGYIQFSYDKGFAPGVSPDATAITIRDTLEVPQKGR